jgi:holliday junction DNA helicase RuvA
MIGKITGKIEDINGNVGFITLESGVSFVSYFTPFIMSQLDKKITVYTYLDVREDALILYSFETKKQHYIFTKLISVDGVGPKSGYNIISRTTPEEVIDAIINKNTGFFKQIPGIGNKTSQRIILDLSSVFGEETDISFLNLTPEDSTLIDALKSLGFKRSEINTVLSKIDKKLGIEEKIRSAIRLLSNK